MIENLGPYQILELISKGGIGSVYKAYHPALDRHVAIKVLSSRFSSDANFVRRFKREAQIVARLEHPHILPVYDFAFDDDIAYLVMKLVQGSSLYSHIGPRGMQPDRAMKVLEAVAKALSHAHRRNIIHRDIKPDNILIDENEWVYLSDFGMAKMVTTTGPTGEGTIMGTPEYMSPEQAQGNPVDNRSDVYSLAVLVFHMLTGTLPFKGNHPLATIKQVIYDPFPNIKERAIHLPKLLDSLLQKAASKDPDDRFADVEEFVKMLGAVLTSAALPETQELFVRKSRLAVIPFAVADKEHSWLSDAISEMLYFDLCQNYELYLLSGDQVIRMYRNLASPGAVWAPETLQRFFELSRVDYVITGTIGSQHVDYELKISTTFEILQRGRVEGTIPFHLASMIAQRIRSGLDVPEVKLTSVEQIFRGNLTMLQQYVSGIRAFRDGRFLDADRALRLASQMEPTFAPAHIGLARTFLARGLREQAHQTAEHAFRGLGLLPQGPASIFRAQYYQLINQHLKAAEIYSDFHQQFTEVIEYLVLWGESLVRSERLEEAANVFYEICEKEERIGLGWQRLAWIEEMQAKHEQAWYHFKRAQRLYAAHNHQGGLAATYMGLASISWQRQEWNTSIDYYRRAVESFHYIRWSRGVAEAKYHMALANKKMGSYSIVLPFLKEALDTFHELGDTAFETLCLREILQEPLVPGYAMELAERAIHCATELRDQEILSSLVPLKMKWLIDADHPDTALRFYGAQYEMLLNTSRELHFPLTQLQVGRALMRQERYAEAFQQIEQAVRTFRKCGQERLLAQAMLILCELYLLQNLFEKAHEAADEAHVLVERLTDKEMILEVDLIRARILLAQGQRVKLLQTYIRALKCAEDLGRGTLVHKIKGSIHQLRAVNSQ